MKKPKISREEAVRAHGIYLCGVTAKETARRFNCSINNLYNNFRSYNLKTRSEISGKDFTCFTKRFYNKG